ncbi:MAG TPA: hypothetical protein VFR20_09590 [Burkholderiaceae bacterium]|nr:hypothetical protein [Burkholderiaceae bacterium]
MPLLGPSSAAVPATPDVLNARQQYFSAEQNLDTARYRCLLSRLNLAGLVGTLKDQDEQVVDGYPSDQPRR